MMAVAKCRWELWVSILIALVGFLSTAHMPKGIVDLFIIAGSQLIAFFCALNALLDIRRMWWLERIIAVPWFVALLYTLPVSLWWAFRLFSYSNR